LVVLTTTPIWYAYSYDIMPTTATVIEPEPDVVPQRNVVLPVLPQEPPALLLVSDIRDHIDTVIRQHGVRRPASLWTNGRPMHTLRHTRTRGRAPK
jgi:hypothetical protein